MAVGDVISCQQYASFLVSQTPVYDEMVLRDIRPATSGLLGYYATSPFNAYTNNKHIQDRFKAVFPDVTKPWTTMGNTDCTGSPCDPVGNKIGWGYQRHEYELENQSWESQILCFDQIMLKTQAKAHFAQIISDVLRPATTTIMNYYLQRKALELAGKKFVVNATLDDFTFTWSGSATDPNAYVYLNTSADPTGRLTPNILQTRVTEQYFLGAINSNKEGYDSLQLHTDKDTFRWLVQNDSTLQNAWRQMEFGPAAVEFYKYGLMGKVGDFMVKVLQFPLRFNKVEAGKYQLVLPYINTSVTSGIGSFFNPDYAKAQYQISYINHPRGLEVKPYIPQAVNAEMPFLVRDYGGKWRFGTNDLGADCNGRPIDNVRQNKGKFYADFRLAVNPAHPEWVEAIFHMVDQPCVTIVPVCNTDPGYPAQDYNSADPICDANEVFVATAKEDGTYAVAANSIRINGNVLTHGAISGATLALFVADLAAKWAAATPAQTGTWAVYDTDAAQFNYTVALDPGEAPPTIEIPFTLA